MPFETISIFVDLDQTLIHTLGMKTIAGELGDESNLCDIPVKIKLDKEVHHTILRPGANFLLFRLKEIGHVYMLTRASKEYAKAMNKAFNFGFTEDRIFDKEYVENWKHKTPKIEHGDNFLIDDLNLADNFEKIAFIKKFGTSKYIKVNAFYGQKDEGYTHTDINNIIETIKTVE